ncbi:MAG: DUF3227 domain-containing protein [Thermococci archaeon]|nr:DUF3227 domain-containing protein [Thermococci archaeon]
MGLEKDILVKTANEVLQSLGPYFKEAIEAYLRAKYNAGIDLIGDDPEEFYNALAVLFGEFATNVFFSKLLSELGIKVEYPLTGTAIVRSLKTYLDSRGTIC